MILPQAQIKPLSAKITKSFIHTMLLDIANKSIHTYQFQFSRRQRKIISLERERERERERGLDGDGSMDRRPLACRWSWQRCTYQRQRWSPIAFCHWLKDAFCSFSFMLFTPLLFFSFFPFFFHFFLNCSVLSLHLVLEGGLKLGARCVIDFMSDDGFI